MTDSEHRGRGRSGPKGEMTPKLWGWLIAASIGLGGWPPSEAQIPGMPAAPKAATAPKDDPSRKPVPAKGEPGAVFSATSGPIRVNQVIDDPAIEKVLHELISQYPGVREVRVSAREGMVTLDGQVDDDDSMNDVTAFAQKVEGVRLVLNKMKTDAEALSGSQKAMNVLREYRQIVAKNWLLALVALGFVFAFTTLARLFNQYSETLLAPFFRNTLLKSVVGSVVSSLLVLSGVMIGLSILNLTHAVLSILGLAGVAGLALGFAFRDIAENFIASMLLGLRRPFGIGDFITVAGRSGSVLSLDTRATTLITPEGNHVRIPNAVIYKETLVNASITPSVLGTLEVTIPYEISTAEAVEAINEALRTTDGVLGEPTPRALVQALEPGGVRLKAAYWMPSKGWDVDKLQSDLRLKIKVGLQKAGMTQPQPPATPPAVTIPAPQVQALKSSTHTPAPTAAEANLRKDTEAAAHTSTEHTDHEATPIDHAIRQAEAAAVAEGGNMLVNAKG